MADLQHDYGDWAARKAGKSGKPGQGAQPQGGEQQPGENDTGENQVEGEAPPPAHECVSHAAQEVTEAIEMLEKAKGQVEDADAVQKLIDDLTVAQQEATELAKELEEAAGEAEEDDEDEGDTPEPEAV
jgi:hypothetical protein